MTQKECDDRLSGWLQCPTGEPVCCAHHTGFICRGSLPPMGAAGERPEFDIIPTLEAPILISPRGNLLERYFHKGILLQDSGGLKSELSLS